jgi:hypothetical protein
MVASKNPPRWYKTLLLIMGIPLLLIILVLGIAITFQGKIVKETLAQLNENFEGRIVLGGSHISPFENFPYMSIDLEDLEIYESKASDGALLLQVADAYIGFDIYTIISGDYEVKKLKLKSGFLKLVQHSDGSFNIANALTSGQAKEEFSDLEESLHLDLQAIELTNIDLLKLNEENNILVEAFIEDGRASFKTKGENIEAFLDSRFLFNLILDNDTSFLHHKHVELHGAVTLIDRVLNVQPSALIIEKALFLMEGSIDLENDMNLDLTFSGRKPNFDLILAFVPEELLPLTTRYENGGNIYFDATVKGRSINEYSPQIDINFGCSEAFVHNKVAGKEVNELFFKGHFTNGALQDPSTMLLTIADFSAKPESGNFSADIKVENFESPNIDVQLNSEFNLDFLTDFFEIKDLEDVSGKIALEMNFHDIIDLSQPEKSIERLNESYFTKLKVENLSFKSTSFHLPVKDINIDATMDGHMADIRQFNFKIGGSDVAIQASISDLPAILHHTDQPVEAILDIRSSQIDVQELTQSMEDIIGIDEQISDLQLRLKFNSSARAFTESPNLPMGEFFVEKLSAQLTNYPHRLHDFNVDVFVDEQNFRIVDFTGMIDKSDFHFHGSLENYELFFEEHPKGTTNIDFNLNSTLIQLEDLFSYGGENYLPKDYHHEEFKKLKLHGYTTLEFDEKLIATDLKIDKLEASMKIHPMRFENFKGELSMDSSHVEVRDFGGKLGNSAFNTNLTYFLNQDQTKTPHIFRLESKRLDFDQLFAYNPPPAGKTITPEEHEAVFNVFELPFADMNFELQIDHLNYHRYLIDSFLITGRVQENHYAYIDTMTLQAAGGQVNLNGYFNGADPKAIYFSPNLNISHLDLDKMLFKFENFGQDYLVSENLHGELTGGLRGKVHMHADMVPIIDDSQLQIECSIYNGSLNNFSAFSALSSYFTDKNLNNIRFDTLKNNFIFDKGTLTIPKMDINSSIGYLKLSGKQSITQEMEYYIQIPLKMIAKAGMQKLFAKKERDTSDQVDEIQYEDESKSTRFLNLKITGTPDVYEIAMEKNKN